MNLLLAEIAKNVAPDAHAALLVDRAGWHMTDKLLIPPNITLVPLPAKCPELNPAENVWQSLRDNWLSNRVFKSYDDILDHCCFAWNKLIDMPWKIISIGTREWAYRSKSARLGMTDFTRAGRAYPFRNSASRAMKPSSRAVFASY